jgi:hypothetical protein
LLSIEAEQRQIEANALAAEEKAKEDAAAQKEIAEAAEAAAKAAEKLQLEEEEKFQKEAEEEADRLFELYRQQQIAAAKEAADAEEAAEEARKIQDDANKKIEDAAADEEKAKIAMSVAGNVADNAALNIAVVQNLMEDRKDTLACPFTFKMGVSKVVVPPGCTFFGTNDVSYLKQKRTSTPAVYFCTKSDVPLELSSADFKKYGLQSSISYIQPGEASHIVFFSGDHMKGMSSSFNSKSYAPLNSFKYHDGSSANDNVKSATITTRTDTIPENCNDLTFSKNMKLNSKLMEKGGYFL